MKRFIIASVCLMLLIFNYNVYSQDELVADFLPSQTELTADDCISFTDLSLGEPTEWLWSFPGAATTSSKLQNPSNICYRIPGKYDVILEVRKDSKRNTYTCKECITVALNPEVPVADFEANATVVPVNGIVRFTNKSINGPFDQWVWTFGDKASPDQSTDSAPPPVVYREPGIYSVTLRCRKTNGNQNIHTKTNYIRVVAPSNTAPTANFTSNFTVIKPGQSVNFMDLSLGTPYKWNWAFEGSNTTTSSMQNPTNIIYQQAGKYKVTLTVENNIGTDEVVKESFIVVSETDPCLENPSLYIPQAEFSADNRLIAYNGSVTFQNLSTNYPVYNYWQFEGGEPATSSETSPSSPILYKTPGIYKVTLTSTNECGATSKTKEKYVYVFSGTVGSYCEELTTIETGDIVKEIPYPDERYWGYLAGHNGRKVREYANFFSRYTFNQIKGVEIPVRLVKAGENGSNIRIKVWDGSTDVPEILIDERTVYLRDLVEEQVNRINFDPPIDVEGPFYLGFRVNYSVDPDNDGITDDLFVCGLVNNRGISGNNNFYILMPGTSGSWQSCTDAFGFNTSLDINPISCLVDIEDISIDSKFNVYPNPSNGIINIQLTDESYKNFNIEIYDALGRKCNVNLSNISSNEYSADLSSHPQGLYIVRIVTEKGIANKKLLLTK